MKGEEIEEVDLGRLEDPNREEEGLGEDHSAAVEEVEEGGGGLLVGGESEFPDEGRVFRPRTVGEFFHAESLVRRETGG